MDSALSWRDQYTVTNYCSIYVEEQHHIPGVRTLARYIMKNALPSLDWHYHENTFEFTIATKGSITFCTPTSSYKFSGGDVFVSFPNEIHGTNHTPITLGEVYWFQLDISDPDNFLYLDRDTAHYIIAQLKAIPHHVVQANAEEVCPLLKQAVHLVQTGSDPHFVSAYLLLFLHLVIANSHKEQFRLTPDIGRTLDYILDHITSELSLEELASLANLSCSQYKQKFKKQLGISPRRFINQQKIEQAKLLLQEGMSATDIAMFLGFNTSAYFSTVFKKYTLCTPMEYVKSLQDKESD
ncbi:MAG: helix-turn-helix domain-containing protein [Oliverpabstia sp.]